MVSCWEDTSRSVRAVVGGLVLVLTYGTVVHLLQLVESGFTPYATSPG